MEFQTSPRRGLSAVPVDGWPLDGLLVGVATLRTTRHLFGGACRVSDGSFRPWDVALWSGVTPQGTRLCMERLCALGLVREVGRRKPWHARTYRLVERHPLVSPLSELFRVERSLAGQMRGISRFGRYDRRARRTLQPRGGGSRLIQG